MDDPNSVSTWNAFELLAQRDKWALYFMCFMFKTDCRGIADLLLELEHWGLELIQFNY